MLVPWCIYFMSKYTKAQKDMREGQRGMHFKEACVETASPVHVSSRVLDGTSWNDWVISFPNFTGSSLRIRTVFYLALYSQHLSVCMHAQSLQLCLTLFNAMDYSSPGSSVHGILQARIMSGLACPSAEVLPNPGIILECPVLQGESLSLSHQGSPP